MSIFARQLRYVLLKHGKDLKSLYGVRIEEYDYYSQPISAEKIKRLKAAAQGDVAYSTTLNRYELEAVQKAFSFTSDEMTRLRAALAAESLWRFLLDRIDSAKALVVGDALFHLLFDADDRIFYVLRGQMVNNIRGDELDEAEDVPVEQEALPADGEMAIEAYENAIVWLEAARVARNDVMRRGYLAMAASLLQSAQELLAKFTDKTIQLEEWQHSVAQALHLLNLLKDQ